MTSSTLRSKSGGGIHDAAHRVLISVVGRRCPMRGSLYQKTRR